MISSRLAVPVILILTIALVPTIIHKYIHLLIDDGMSAKRINITLGDYQSVPTKRSKRWVKEVFESDDWIERTYNDSLGFKARLFVARSYNHKRLYHHPELALSYGQNLQKAGIKFIQIYQHKIPVHTFRHTSGRGMISYAFYYDGEFIKEPILHQIFDSINLLIRGKKHFTLFYISDTNQQFTDNFSDSATATLLTNAIQSFISQNKTN